MLPLRLSSVLYLVCGFLRYSTKFLVLFLFPPLTSSPLVKIIPDDSSSGRMLASLLNSISRPSRARHKTFRDIELQVRKSKHLIVLKYRIKIITISSQTEKDKYHMISLICRI